MAVVEFRQMNYSSFRAKARTAGGIAVMLAEWFSVGTPAIPRLAALARNDKRSRYSIDPSASANRWCDSVSGGT